MAVFTLPPQHPAVVVYAQPHYGGAPIVIASHGNNYVITGNTLLLPAMIENAVARASSPRDALTKTLALYTARGYFLVELTAQRAGGTIRIEVFEGMLASVNTPPGLAPFFSGLSGRTTLKKPALDRDQILASSYAARSGQKLAFNLAPASNPGGANLTVSSSKLPDYFPLSGTAIFGNTGSRYSSDYIAGANASLDLPYGIQLTADLMHGIPGLQATSFGSKYEQKGASASIVTPYGIYDVTVNTIRYRLGKDTYPLNPDGNIYTLALDGAQLLYADDTTRAIFTESLARVGYKETVLDGYYTLLQQTYDDISGGGSLAKSFGAAKVNASLSFSAGISGASGTLQDSAPGLPTSHFRYIDLQLSYQQTLPFGLQASLTTQAQISANTLPVQQQFVLGGLSALSAWEPGILTGDSGYAARLEIDDAILQKPHISAVLGPFLEVGGSTFTTPAPDTPPWQVLADCGVSLRLQLPYQLSATVAAAVPISEAGFDAAGRSDLRFNRTSAFFAVEKGF